MSKGPASLATCTGAALLHAAASLAQACVLAEMLPAAYRAPRGHGLALFFCIGFFIPVLGSLGLLALVRLGLCRHRSAAEDWMLAIETAPLPARPRPESRFPRQRQGLLVEVLAHSPRPERRLESILRTRHLENRDAIPILRQGLKDAEDEVRLLSFALIDGKEKAINARIQELQSCLEAPASADSEARAQLHHELAQQHWALVDAGLAQGNLSQHALERALVHAQAASEALPHDAGLRLLLGRICLRLGEERAARQHLEAARELGLPRSKVAPYLAELAFQRGDYHEVESQIEQLSPLGRALLPLSLLHAYWCPASHPRRDEASEDSHD